jgi:Family of unknown function (DUF5338)
MKNLSTLLRAKYGNSSVTGKRAQIRNEMLLRGKDILTELSKGWSMRAIWEVLAEAKEITCSYKTFAGHVRRLQAKGPARAITPEKESIFQWESQTPDKKELI